MTMTPQEKQKFLDEFLPKYLASGFGSMPKSEIDLLIFRKRQCISTC